MDLDQIVNKVYTYYPKHHSPFSTDYDFTKEVRQKTMHIPQLKAEVRAAWHYLIQCLQQDLDHYGIMDESAAFDKDFCNYLMYNTKSETGLFRVHLLLSVLEPVHAILISLYSGPDNNHIITCDYDEEVITRDGSRQAIMNDVVKVNGRVGEIFKTQEIKMRVLSSIVVQDIATQSKAKGTVTLFDCLFTDHLAVY